jgi:hypothetical protein
MLQRTSMNQSRYLAGVATSAQINGHTSTDSHNTPLDSFRCAQNDMVYWGEDRNLELVRCIKRGDIDPHNTDGDYLFGKMVQLFKCFEGDGTTRSRANVIARLRKILRNYCFDGTLPGRQKRAACFCPSRDGKHDLSPIRR